MNSTLEVLTRNPKIKVEPNQINILGVETTLYKCDRIEDSLSNKLISKYLVIDLINKHDLLVGIASSKKAFDAFQEKFIAPLFYKYRDDLRWNIYTIMLVDSTNAFQNEVKLIENDEDYSRKFVFSLEEFDEFLNYGYLGNVKDNNDLLLKTNFVLEWENSLAEIGLAGCIYDSFKKTSFDDYIAKDKPINPVGRPLQNKTSDKVESDLSVERINKVTFSNFRSHCFGERFEFTASDINLFSGTNGSGKTSLCEAIELGLTGKVKGVEPSSDCILEVECLNENKDKIFFKSSTPLKKQREIDLAWYGTTTTGSKSRLNENFSIFNYITSNSAMSYTNSKSNINELLQNLMYGDETTDANGKIVRYEKEFQTSLKSLKKERQENKNLIDETKKKIDLLKESIKNIDNFDEQYQKVGLSNSILDLNASTREEKIKDAIRHTREVVSILVDYFSATQTERNYSDVIEAIEILKNNLVRSEKTISLLEIEQTNLNGLKVKKANIVAKRDLLIKRHNQVEEFNKLFDEVPIGSYKNTEQINSFINNFQKCERSERELNALRSDFKDELILNEEPQVDVEEYDKLVSDISRISNEIIVEKKKVDSFMDLSDTNANILMSLKEYGVKYISINPLNTECPLCKHSFDDKEMLVDAISGTEYMADKLNNDLLILKNNLFALESELKTLQSYRAEFDKRIKQKVKIDKLRVSFNKIVNGDENLSMREINKSIQDLTKKYNDFIIDNQDIYSNITEIKKNQLYYEFATNGDNLIEYVNIQSQTIQAEIIELNNKVTELDDNILLFSGINEKFVQESTSKEKILVEINKKTMAKNNIRSLSKYFEVVEKTCDFLNWSSEYNKMDIMVNYIHESNVISKGIQQEIETLNNYEARLILIDSQLSRCKKAIEIISGLPSLEENMKSFINQNAHKIEKIFRLVHRPKEFADISIEDGHITFVRESTGEKTNISEVSTGQSISLVFAITLCLHLTAEKAPNFIIMDEPVANMDDMHIINLIDIIRELALGGTQIFITTANNQVSNFLRRKFSFFGKSFKHIKLERIDENLSDISEIIYSPFKENPIEYKKLS